MSYEPTVWAPGDTVTAVKLNKLEQGVKDAGDSGGGLLVTCVVDLVSGEDNPIAPIKGGETKTSGGSYNSPTFTANKTAREILEVVNKGGSVVFKTENFGFYSGYPVSDVYGYLTSIDHVTSYNDVSCNLYILTGTGYYAGGDMKSIFYATSLDDYPTTNFDIEDYYSDLGAFDAVSS